MFEIGDRVKNNYPDSKRYGMRGEVTDVDEDAETIVVEYSNGDEGGGKYSSFINLDNGDSTATPQSKGMSILSRIADAFRSEPEKTYRALGIKDSSGNLTSEGKDLLLNALFDANEETLIRPKAIALLAEEKKNK
jgi:hypothetical protein